MASLLRGLIGAIALLVGGAALAADTGRPAPPADPSPQVRGQMAEVHQRMAACLTSTRPIAECRTEMLKNCQDLMGANGCPMMGAAGGGMGPGMMRGTGMGPAMMRGGPAPQKPPN